MRKSVLAVLLVTVLLATIATFFGAQRYFEQLETNATSNRLVLYLRALNETLRQHQHLPFVLARDSRYSDAFDPANVDRTINAQLDSLAQEAKLEAIYVMNSKGVVLASSNADEPQSFLGQNYGFRPYFQEALKGNRSDYFAIGATTGRPGYFVAEPASLANGREKGVIAIKLDVSEFQRSWESDSDTVVAVNKDNIVVLASNPDWLYRRTDELDIARRDQILESRQFGAQTLEPLEWTQTGDNRFTVDGTKYLMASGTSDWRDWTVHYLQPEAKILRQTIITTALFGGTSAILLGFATFLRSRRIEQAYKASERQRTELIKANQQLEEAQSELARSAKLAALGHMAASVTHELGQPISAFRNHLAAAELSQEITSPKTASSLNKLVDRMEAITRQFRYFARSSTVPKTQIRLDNVLTEAATLLKTELKDITFHLPDIPKSLQIYANQVQLEQAFINLLKNAVHAVENQENPEISVHIKETETTVEIRICDNGQGVATSELKDLQEPFFSTKPSGVGMGLGLAITTEIINDHGGELTLGAPEEGAEFIVTLPLTHEKAPS